jgi:hypothetical protein
MSCMAPALVEAACFNNMSLHQDGLETRTPPKQPTGQRRQGCWPLKEWAWLAVERGCRVGGPRQNCRFGTSPPPLIGRAATKVLANGQFQAWRLCTPHAHMRGFWCYKLHLSVGCTDTETLNAAAFLFSSSKSALCASSSARSSASSRPHHPRLASPSKPPKPSKLGGEGSSKPTRFLRRPRFQIAGMPATVGLSHLLVHHLPSQNLLTLPSFHRIFLPGTSNTSQLDTQ